MFEKYKKALLFVVDPLVIENYALTVQSPLKGLKGNQNLVFSLFQQTSHG